MLISRRTLLLAVFCLANLFAGSLYSWSVFSDPLAQKLSVSAADLAFIFSVAAGINPFAMISGGWFNDRFGPKYVLTVGGLMIGRDLCWLHVPKACSCFQWFTDFALASAWALHT